MMKVRKSLGGRASGAALKGLVVASAMALASPVFAQSNALGFIYGVAPTSAGEVTIQSKDTGYTRTVGVGSNGDFRFDALPIGRYVVTYEVDGKTMQEEVSVSLNKGSQVRFATGTGPTDLGTTTVTGAIVGLVDTISTETSTTFSAEELERMPVRRDISSVQLLAPDAVEGSNDFETQQGNPLVAFGGASPMENAYYLNGFNITDFRKGLGGSEVPFEFYQDINIRTGGYSAEFGRSIGGSISTVSKTGTNEFKAGGNIFWEPDFGREDYPDVEIDGDPLYINNDDERDKYEANIFASGPIIKDKLFFYALVGTPYLKSEGLGTGGTTLSSTKSDEPVYWAANILANIAPGHQIQFTGFSDERDYKTIRTTYDYEAGEVISDEYDSVSEETVGGQNYIVNYNGQITDWFSLSALYGHGVRKEISNATTVNGDPCPIISDRRGGFSVPLGCSPAVTADTIEDTRDAYRLDATFSFFALGTHQLKIGYDLEELNTDYMSAYPGGGTSYIYSTCVPPEGATTCSVGGVAIPEGQEYVRLRSFDFTGDFDNDLQAYYVQDSWQVTSQLLLDIGVRYDSFDLKGADGKTFLKLDDNWAPRLGLAYDVFGDGRAKFYANYGKYFLPIETNLAARALTIGADTSSYYTFDSIDEAGLPVGIEQFGSTVADIGTGDQAFDVNMKATEQDEYILGFDMQLAPKWVAGVKGTYRTLVEAQEDTCYFNPVTGQYGCVLLNPGDDPYIDGHDYDFDGEPDTLQLSNDTLLLPEAKRKYYAMQFDIDRVYDGKWFMSFSYTWSHLYGNFEGFANSDVGQDDPGITIAFDNFALVSYGDLPNDRRHNFKLFGGYDLTPEWQVGGVLKVASGRPKNAFGRIPPETPGFDPDPDLNEALIGLYNNAYEGEFSFVDGEYSPRGAGGRLPWTWTLDLSVAYSPRLVDGLSVGLDVFNVFDNDEVTNIDEIKEFVSDDNDAYGTARYADSFQTPRTLRLSARYEFGL